MKLKLLAAACGLALGSQAYALSPSDTDAAIKVYLSGSSAQVRVIKAVAAADCATGTLDTYQLASDTGNVFGVSCTLNATAGGGTSGLGGQNVFITYNANGGSANGVYTVAKETIPSTGALNTAQAALLQRPQLANIAANCTTAGTNLYNCTSTALQYTDAGVSDTEPSLFNIDLNRPTAWVGNSISGDEFNQIDSAAQFQQIFGIAVSQNLYNDLQAMQVAAGTIPTGGTPSLSKSAIANYMAGSFTDPANGFGWQPLFATSTLAQPAGASSQVNICTRTNGSGTKAGASAFFLNNPCGGNTNSLTPASAAQNVPGSFVVNEGGSTGAVTTCLSGANTAGQYAIGIVGKENALPTGAQWIAIDGVSPGKDNVKNGKYDWFVEQSMQWNPTYLNSFKSLPSGVTSAQLTAYLNDFRTRSGSPDVMATYSTTVQDGVAAIDNGSTYLFNDPANANNKAFVSRVTKLNNTCGISLWVK